MSDSDETPVTMRIRPDVVTDRFLATFDQERIWHMIADELSGLKMGLVALDDE